MTMEYHCQCIWVFKYSILLHPPHSYFTLLPKQRIGINFSVFGTTVTPYKPTGMPTTTTTTSITPYPEYTTPTLAPTPGKLPFLQNRVFEKSNWYQLKVWETCSEPTPTPGGTTISPYDPEPTPYGTTVTPYITPEKPEPGGKRKQELISHIVGKLVMITRNMIYFWTCHTRDVKFSRIFYF